MRNSPPIRLLLATLIVNTAAVVVDALCDVVIWAVAKKPES